MAAVVFPITLHPPIAICLSPLVASRTILSDCTFFLPGEVSAERSDFLGQFSKSHDIPPRQGMPSFWGRFCRIRSEDTVLRELLRDWQVWTLLSPIIVWAHRSMWYGTSNLRQANFFLLDSRRRLIVDCFLKASFSIFVLESNITAENQYGDPVARGAEWVGLIGKKHLTFLPNLLMWTLE